MQKLRFLCALACHNILWQRKTSVVLCVSFALGLLLPCIVLGNIAIYYQITDTIRLQDAQRVMVYSATVTGGYEGITRAQETMDQRGIDYSIAPYSVVPMQIHEDSYQIPLRAMDGGYTHFESPVLVRGRMPTHEELTVGAPVCLVETNLALEEGVAISVGDDIRIQGRPYQVIGLVRSFHLYGSVITPLKGMEQVTNPYFFCNIYTKDEEHAGFSMDMLLREEFFVSEKQTGEEYISGIRRAYFQGSLEAFAIGSVALIFAAMNMLQVLSGKMRERFSAYGIHVAHGAGAHDIFLLFYLENCLLMLASIPLMLLVRRIVIPTLPYHIPVILTWPVLAMTICLGMLLCIVFCLFLLRKVKRLTVRQMISGEV